ncbi:CARDB domain-containing protein [Caproiciproducens sp.]
MKKKIHKKALAFMLAFLLLFGTSGQAFAKESLGDSASDEIFTISDCQISDAIEINNELEQNIKDSNIIADNFVLDGISDGKEDSPKDSNMSLRTAAGLPDLSMSIITSPTSQPFPNAIPVKFQSKVLNIGNGPATNLIFTLYVDGNIENSIEAEGTLNAGEEAVLSFFMECNVGGSHSLKIVVNESKTITESNYSNNSAEGYFKWADCIALSADALYTSDGETEFESNQSKEYIFKFSNSGTLSATNVPIELDVNGVNIYQRSINVPAHTNLTGSINISINKAGHYEFVFKVDPQKIINDLNPYDNSKSLAINLSYDTEIWAGKWDNPRNLDVLICGSAVQVINNNNAGSNAISNIKDAIHAWNGIVSQVSYGTVSTSDSDVDIYQKPVSVIAQDLPQSDDGSILLAVTAVFRQGSSGREQVLDPEGDKCSYINAVIVLNEDDDAYSALNSKGQNRTITHEFGHALGLAHPTCRDTAIMRQTSDSLAAYTIQPHDKYNLDKRY